jgi:hypothetical protein
MGMRTATLRRKMTIRCASAFAIGLLAAVAVTPASARAAVLYDQTTGTPGGPVTVGTQDGVDGVPADDFTVPPGATWQLSSFDLLGALSGSGTTFGNFGVFVTGDANGLPGGPRSGQSGPLAAGNDLSIPMPSTVLGAGTYWVTADTLSADPTWKWTSQSPQHGSGGLWQNAASGPPCPAFMPLSACGQPGPDLMFRVNGQPISVNFALGKKTRLPNGGVNIALSFPLRGRYGFDDAGKGDLVKGKSHGLFGKGPFAGSVHVNPTVAVKTELKSRKVKSVRAKVKFTYAPDMLNPPPADQLTQVIKLVFKLPSYKTKK